MANIGEPQREIEIIPVTPAEEPVVEPDKERELEPA